MSAAEVRVLGPVEVVGEAATSRSPRSTGGYWRCSSSRTAAPAASTNSSKPYGKARTASARNLVQVYVSQLRKVLPSGVEVVTHANGYAVDLAAELDAARFEQLAGESSEAARERNAALAASLADRALSLWRGRAYGELAYDEFASRRANGSTSFASRPSRSASTLNSHLATTRSSRRAPPRGGAPVSRALPWAAMLALYRCGRATRSSTTQQFARASTRSSGWSPDGLFASCNGESSSKILSSILPCCGRGRRPPGAPTSLVGRERELDELEALLARRRDRLVVLSGAGGSGKTRLALEAARRAASFANGVRLVSSLPFAIPRWLFPRSCAHWKFRMTLRSNRWKRSSRRRRARAPAPRGQRRARPGSGSLR